MAKINITEFGGFYDEDCGMLFRERQFDFIKSIINACDEHGWTLDDFASYLENKHIYNMCVCVSGGDFDVATYSDDMVRIFLNEESANEYINSSKAIGLGYHIRPLKEWLHSVGIDVTY